MQHDIDTAAASLDASLIALRRDIHAHPELAGHEARTAALVAARMRAAGLAVTTGVGGHGVIAVLEGARPGRTIAYRADMDAVPPHAQSGGGTEPAHLCGHDVHTTVGVGVAEVLAGLRDRLAGRHVFLFQPAEEDLTGARAMLAEDALDGVDEIHALHCGPMPAGTITVTPGNGLPGLDTCVITTASPGDAAQLATDIAELGTVTPPRSPGELEGLITDLTTPGGRLSTFVYMRASAVGDTVHAAWRTWPEDRAETVRADVTALADDTGVVFTAEPFPALVCPEPDALALARHLRATGVPVGVAHAATPFSGEDFALFLRRVPGTYSYLGVRRPGAPLVTGFPHDTAFDPDETAIGTGVRAMAGWLAARAAG
ncbi:N-acyl-L-amino acid amidohydrolase [Actinorhabdospora filicis]|uniref:N-acyl-L-amino acid amidohydrolase n=1 Tax=Actinorhabdospora filicis TaxID=1785913 RepID=A0A9W6SF67_9ACTN|nr:M20/M25/M40 family metallo-hydrolase [Actinorhabdospora filicis]GLZ75198.1 N-acyl-L-amino acid amidohydrolase [Actinorhabdospora filicis]